MIQVNIHDLKAKLAQYIRETQKGKTIIICKRNIPIAELKPLTKKLKNREELFGFAPNLLTHIDDNTFDPLTDKEMEIWEGSNIDPPQKR